MTALEHCSRQVEGGKKLMGQPLVHPQRLGSLVGVSSVFWLEVNKGWLSTLHPLRLGGVFWIGLAYMGYFLWARLCASYKMDINNTCLPWVFIPHGLLLVNTLGFFIDTCNGRLGN